MNKTQYLDHVRSHYRPDLVSVNMDALGALTIEQAPDDTVSVRIPFAQADHNILAVGSPLRHQALLYLLGMTSLQYRFWQLAEGTGEFLRYSFDGRVGSAGLETAFYRAWGPNGVPGSALRDAAESNCRVAQAFGADLPDIDSRRAILSEVLVSGAGSRVAVEVANYIDVHKRVDIELASRVAEMLPRAYGDPFLKKAMLFLGFVTSSMGCKEVKTDLCAYADYQVPNVMRHYGVLRYAPELAQAIENRQLLAAGGIEESAIRAATVLGCEAIAMAHDQNAAAVDWWCFQQRKLPVTPFHLTVTTNY